jgi:hypothetical protein
MNKLYVLLFAVVLLAGCNPPSFSYTKSTG